MRGPDLRQKRGKRAAERKLLPACQHQVKEGMEVFTMNDPGTDGERVRESVKMITELLTADHLKAPSPRRSRRNSRRTTNWAKSPSAPAP